MRTVIKLSAVTLGVASILTGGAIAAHEVHHERTPVQSTAVSGPSLSEPDSIQTNAAGQTYGSELVEASPDTQVDLVLVTVGGVEGYVKSEDLEIWRRPPTGTPAEALEWQREHADGVDLPMYASDGVTVIGKFHMAGVNDGSTRD